MFQKIESQRTNEANELKHLSESELADVLECARKPCYWLASPTAYGTKKSPGYAWRTSTGWTWRLPVAV